MRRGSARSVIGTLSVFLMFCGTYVLHAIPFFTSTPGWFDSSDDRYGTLTAIITTRSPCMIS